VDDAGVLTKGEGMLSDAEVGAAIAVKDLDAAKDWYGKMLGLTPDREAPDGVYYRCKGQTVMFIYPSSFAGTAQNTVAGFRVDDLEREMEELRSRGITFEEYDMPGMKTENGVMSFPSGRGAWFKDLDGNILALTQENA
jgi:catechol 2,3-dioxygenase-like lactoylglutathione lyase family enzyme